MHPDASPVDATLAAWRAQGAHRIAPVRFHYLEALQRRLPGHEGDARRALEARLATLIEAYADGVARASQRRGNDGADVVSSQSGNPGPLAGLVGILAERAPAPRSEMPVARDHASAGALPQLDVLDDFRKLWSDVRTQSQLRQSLEQTADDAGPLNSSRLVHRMITCMRAVSPDYLHHFLSYVDALAWLERMQGVAPTASQAEGARKRPRKRKS